MCLPRNLHFEVRNVLRLPQNLRSEVPKVLRVLRNLHFKVRNVLCLPRYQRFEAHKVLRLPRNLHFIQDSHAAALTRRFAARTLPKTTSRYQNAAFQTFQDF